MKIFIGLKKRKRKRINKNIFILFLFILLLFPLFSFSRQLEVDYPFIDKDSLTTDISIGDYVNLIFRLLIRTGVILAFVIIVVSGVMYMLSPANPQIAHSSRNRIFNAFFGVLIIIGGYLLLRIADPEFTVLRTPEITKTPPVIIDVPPIEMEDIILPPDSYKSVIMEEVPIGIFIKNIFELDQLEGGAQPYKELRRMERIKEIALNIYENSYSLFDRNNNLISSLKECSCKMLEPRTVGIYNPIAVVDDDSCEL